MGNELYFRRPSVDEHGARFGSVQAALDYTLSGKAGLTLRSERTGECLEFRVEKAVDRRGNGYVWFVKASAPLGWVLVGLITAKFEFRSTQPSQSAQAFSYFWKHLASGEIAPKLDVLHAGRCGFCNRALKEGGPLRAGFGDECVKRVPRVCLPVAAAPTIQEAGKKDTVVPLRIPTHIPVPTFQPKPEVITPPPRRQAASWMVASA